MSFADTSMRGACLNARLFVNGIHNDSSAGGASSGAWRSAERALVLEAMLSATRLRRFP